MLQSSDKNQQKVGQQALATAQKYYNPLGMGF